MPDDTYEVSQGSSNCLAIIIIPETHNDKKVTKIKESGFENCDKLLNISFSNTIINIGENAFNGCESLIDIIFSDSIKNIGNNAFAGCSSLKSLTLPSNIASMPDLYLKCFKDCSIKEIKILPGAKVIGDSLFYGCI
ncbi:MAG: leucine-rich repeat domain-containing protein [Acholeplasmatales bacterium]|nr:leucine-rich repeat domain-containing protein [Acholeplasmatales bacterium]